MSPPEDARLDGHVLGFAIAPTVVLRLEVAMLDAAGRATWTCGYASGTVEMPAA